MLIKTNKGTYKLTTKEKFKTVVLNETEEVSFVESVFDNETNKTINVTKTKIVNKTINESLGVDLGIRVYEAPSNNIQKGLDLAGGTRVLLQPEVTVSDEDLDFILNNIRQRFNVYGLSDLVVKKVTDFTGESYILVEIAGASQSEVVDLLSKQGKFEAKIGDDVVFRGGKDIKYVDKSATGSGLDPRRGCQESSDGWLCGFRFGISLSPEAAKREADITSKLTVVYDGTGGEGYLSKNISLFLDDVLVDELRIGSGLKGNAETEISISGSGTGPTRESAQENALNNMKELQTVLQTGSLPVKLNIIEVESVSPTLGTEFLKNMVLIGLLAILAVAIIVSVRYRKFIVSVPVIVTMLAEVVLLLGFAVIARWQLDLAAIAGILIAVGTGVDDQIVIVDETLRGRGKKSNYDWKSKLKKAFFIIMASYFTTVVAMIPLLASGAGLLKGFALTTIAGVSFGVFITRPAFASIFETLVGKKTDEGSSESED